ncbi:hypothetical protein GCM10029964_110120 [Kibdelosporangium lantanae]
MTTTALLAAIHEHLATFDLPEPWSVTAHADPGYGRDPLCVQLRGGTLPAVALVLLAWADTLTDISAEVWRVPDGGSVHLSVRGQLAGGIVVRVFDGVDHGAHLDLEPNQQRPVSSPACGNGPPSIRE